MTLRTTTTSFLPPSTMSPTTKAHLQVTLLILGAGWTYQFLRPLLIQSHPKITFAATTTTGHDQTIPFKFDPHSDDSGPYKCLPKAQYVLITFPLTGEAQSAK